MAEQNSADIITHVLVTPLLIASFVGNTLAIIVKLHRIKSKAFNSGDLLIVNLAICDINKTWAMYITWIYAYVISDQWKYSILACSLPNKLDVMLFSVTSLTLLLLTIERYLLIMKPFNRWFSLRKTKIVLAALWIGVFIACGEPYFFQFGLIKIQGKPQCSVLPHRGIIKVVIETLFLMLVIILPCIIIFILSTQASRRLFKSMKSCCSHIKTSSKFNNKMRRNKNAIYMLRSITIGSMLCYIPWVAGYIARAQDPEKYLHQVDQSIIQPLLAWFIFGGFCNTPLTYLIFSTEFRKEIKALVEMRRRSKSSSVRRVSPANNKTLNNRVQKA